MVERAIQKWWPEPQDEPTDDEVLITGEDKVMAAMTTLQLLLALALCGWVLLAVWRMRW